MSTRLPLQIILDSKGFAFETGHSFRGLTFSQKNGTWNIIVRGTSRQGNALYAMNTSDDPQAGLDNLLEALCAKGGRDLWRIDRYATLKN